LNGRTSEANLRTIQLIRLNNPIAARLQSSVLTSNNWGKFNGFCERVRRDQDISGPSVPLALSLGCIGGIIPSASAVRRRLARIK